MQHDPRCGAILCAAEEELAPFLPHLAEEQRLSRAMLTLHIGRIGGLQMVLAATGMCKVNAALAVQTVLDTVSPDFVLNAGTAGGMSPALGLFETAVTTECAYHDAVGEAVDLFCFDFAVLPPAHNVPPGGRADVNGKVISFHFHSYRCCPAPTVRPVPSGRRISAVVFAGMPTVSR